MHEVTIKVWTRLKNARVWTPKPMVPEHKLQSIEQLCMLLRAIHAHNPNNHVRVEVEWFHNERSEALKFGAFKDHP